jgi:hypothetical protein
MEWVDYNSITNDIGYAGSTDPTGHKMQNHPLSLMDKSVAGVVTTPVTNDELCVLREQINDLALPLIAPQEAGNTSCGHGLADAEKVGA